VTGYVVYVGTAPGDYSDSYDVGGQTSLTLTVPEGRRYYFAVSSYANEREGPRSSEISGIGTSESTVLSRTSFLTSASPAATPAGPTPVCFTGDSAGCYGAQTIASGLGRITAIAATPEGLRFIEDGRHLRVVSGDELYREPALAVNGESSRLTGLAVDPAFGSTGAIFVGRADRRTDGIWELTVTRYRELRFLLGEPAAVASGLPLPSPVETPIALDDGTHVYLALPAFDGRRDSLFAYNGFVLRFSPDGTAPRDSRAGSPVFAYGYASPTALSWSTLNGGELWLAGRGSRTAGGLARVESSVSAEPWPAVPRVVGVDVPTPAPDVDGLALAAPGKAPALFIATSGMLRRTVIPPAGAWPTWSAADFGLSGDIAGVAAGPNGDVYVVVAGTSFSILRLRPQ
jgi:hypothetical protein